MNARDGGFYDSDGVWHSRGSGRLDSDGYWIAETPSASSYGANVTYNSRDRWAGAPYGLRDRESWLEQRIRTGMNDGSLRRGEAERALNELGKIRNKEAAYRRPDGSISPRDRASIQARLDNLSAKIRFMRHND